MLLALIVAFIFCAPPSKPAEEAGPPPVEEVKWHSFEDEAIGYGFAYPEGWQIADAAARRSYARAARVGSQHRLLFLLKRTTASGTDFMSVVARPIPRAVQQAHAISDSAELNRWMMKHPELRKRPADEPCPSMLHGGFSTRETTCFSSNKSPLRRQRVEISTTYGFRPLPAVLTMVSDFSDTTDISRESFIVVWPLPDWRNPNVKLTGNCVGPRPKNDCELAAPCPLHVREDSILVKSVEPVYPPEARRRGIQGKVVLTCRFNGDGKLVQMRAWEGDDLLVPAAMEAVRQREYKPYIFMGEGRDVETRIEVKFAFPTVERGRLPLHFPEGLNK